jgi:hypothetical protein
MSTSFWINEPSILINKKDILNFWPTENMNYNQKLNSISRLIIILTIIGAMITQTLRMLITGLITLGVIILLYFIQKKEKSKKEGFSNNTINNATIHKYYEQPKLTNPLMNVCLTEYKENINRKPAAPSFNPDIKKKINEDTKTFIVSNFNNSNKNEDNNIESRLFLDLGDNYNFNQSMRNFYSTPNTTIPNDQNGFAEFCYGNMISCKEDNPIACSKFNPRWIDGNS